MTKEENLIENHTLALWFKKDYAQKHQLYVHDFGFGTEFLGGAKEYTIYNEL
jgi:hypothetical protein